MRSKTDSIGNDRVGFWFLSSVGFLVSGFFWCVVVSWHERIYRKMKRSWCAHTDDEAGRSIENAPYLSSRCISSIIDICRCCWRVDWKESITLAGKRQIRLVSFYVLSPTTSTSTTKSRRRRNKKTKNNGRWNQRRMERTDQRERKRGVVASKSRSDVALSTRLEETREEHTNTQKKSQKERRMKPRNRWNNKEYDLSPLNKDGGWPLCRSVEQNIINCAERGVQSSSGHFLTSRWRGCLVFRKLR